MTPSLRTPPTPRELAPLTPASATIVALPLFVMPAGFTAQVGGIIALGLVWVGGILVALQPAGRPEVRRARMSRLLSGAALPLGIAQVALMAPAWLAAWPFLVVELTALAVVAWLCWRLWSTRDVAPDDGAVPGGRNGARPDQAGNAGSAGE